MNDNVLRLNFVGVDDWGRRVFLSQRGNSLYFKDLNVLDMGKPEYCTASSFWGEPDIPLSMHHIYKDYTVETYNVPEENPFKFEYMLLDRYRMDVLYFLGNGNRNERQLYQENIDEHILKMKELYHIFPLDRKPEWLSLEDIEQFERQMKGE